MVSVFFAFIINGDPTVKQFGVGMGVAVAVDATLVRCLLVPAVMVLLGRANWWFPGWLDKITPELLDRGRGVVPRARAAAARGGAGTGGSRRARRPANARPSVTSSAYSRSPPTGRPEASRVTAVSGARVRRTSAMCSAVASPVVVGLVARTTSRTGGSARSMRA